MNNRNEILKSIEQLKKKGVTAIKVELEADFNRMDDGECSSCEGSGNRYCSDCSDGEVWTGEEYVECGECEGNYRTDCDECEGTGNLYAGTYNFRNDSDCLNHILDTVASLTGETRNDNGTYEDAHDGEAQQDAFPWMPYVLFYEDGSVDSEMTFTVKIDNPTNVFYIPQIIEAFKSIGEQTGTMEVHGAGMHTALLFDKDSVYPSRTMPSDRQIDNFTRSMTQLLPALYFLGTTNERTRGLGYRVPRIGVGHGYKYSAVYINNGAFEYRVFDTCYDNPSQILDNIVVIANTMKYLSDRYINPKVSSVSSMHFGVDNGNSLDRLYTHTNHLEVLNNGLKRIKPSYYTIRELKQQRKFTRTMRRLNSDRRDQEHKAELAYKEYVERHEFSLLIENERERASAIEALAYEIPPRQIIEMSRDEIEERIKKQVEDRMAKKKANRTPMVDYIKDAIQRYERGIRGDYQLVFN